MRSRDQVRSLLQYDLDEPLPSLRSSVSRPPAKKRRRNHNNSQKSRSGQPQKAHIRHWDDPGNATVGVVYDVQEIGAAGDVTAAYADELEEGEEGECGEGAEAGEDTYAAVGEEEEEDEEEEESRLLTHGEIWDDAALIDAWNSAEAEYEAYHGASKSWKTEPVKKSPLWYNKPNTAPIPQPGPSKRKPPQKSQLLYPQGQEDDEPDTAPLDFNTYVPTHDPSLGITSDPTANPATNVPFFVPPPSTTTVSRDEAFNNALSAMYWGGYWTAVYHCQSQTNGQNHNAQPETKAIEENGMGAGEEQEEGSMVAGAAWSWSARPCADGSGSDADSVPDLVPTQR